VGTITSWDLNLFTTPTVAVVTNSDTIATNSLSVPATSLTTSVGENGSVTVNLIVADSSGPVSLLGVTPTKIPNLVTNFTVSGSDQNRAVTIIPNQNTFGQSVLTITVTNGLGATSTNIFLNVKHVNQPPQISLSTNSVTTVAGLMTTNIVVATVSDVDTNFDP